MKQLFLTVFFVFLFILGLVGDCDNKEYVYIVKETGYFHKSKKKGNCSFVRKAEDNGYKLIRADKKVIHMGEYKICLECFTPEEIREYKEKLSTWLKTKEEEIREGETKDAIIMSVSEETRKVIIDAYEDGFIYYDGSYEASSIIPKFDYSRYFEKGD